MADEIETERLRLVPVAAVHVDLLVGLDADPEVMRFLTDGEPSSIDDVTRIVEQERGHRWVAFERDGDAFVGWFGIPPSGPGEVELGYRLVRSAWGRGLATEGAQAMVALAWSQGAERIWAQTMAVNERSRRVMDAVGLTYVRTFFGTWSRNNEGAEHGDVIYALLRPEA